MFLLRPVPLSIALPAPAKCPTCSCRVPCLLPSKKGPLVSGSFASRTVEQESKRAGEQESRRAREYSMLRPADRSLPVFL